MNLKSGIALVGGLVAAAGITGLYLGVGVGWIMLIVVVSLSVLSYIIAAIAASPTTKTTGIGEFMRGWLIGLNASLNAVLGFAVVSLFAGTIGGLVVGLALGVINLLTVIGPISQSGFFHGVIGYLNWLLPMSWLIVALGFAFYLISFLLHAVTVGKVPYLKVQDIGADWKTGTFFIKGGLIANLNYADTAFNMGNFSFVDYKSSAWHKEHEAGHTLNLAAFGSLFHLIGALDENATPRGANAFSERLAESNATGHSGTNIPMWA